MVSLKRQIVFPGGKAHEVWDIRLLGVPAMADFYTVFDMQNARMGFASQSHLQSSL